MWYVLATEWRNYAKILSHSSQSISRDLSSNYPFEYELPCIYSHLISVAGGVPNAISHVEGEVVFCYPYKATQLTERAASLASWCDQCKSTQKWVCSVTVVLLWVQSHGNGNDFLQVACFECICWDVYRRSRAIGFTFQEVLRWQIVQRLKFIMQ